MKIKCKFVLLHDQDNDPLLVNVDKIKSIAVNSDGKTTVVFSDVCSVNTTESVTKVLNTINTAKENETDDLLLLHDGKNNHLVIRISEIVDIFIIPKNSSKGKSKAYFGTQDGDHYYYLNESVNKIYSLLCGKKDDNVSSPDNVEKKKIC